MTNTPENALNSLLSNNSAVTAAAPGGVWTSRLPQEVTLPAASIHLLSTKFDVAHDKSVGDEGTYQISCWGDTSADVVTLGNAVVAALQSFKGTVDGLEIDRIEVINLDEMPPVNENDFHRVVTVQVYYQ